MRHAVFSILALPLVALAEPPSHGTGTPEGSKANAVTAVAGGLAAVAMLPPEKKGVVLQKVDDVVRQYGADSCEAQYYSLFAAAPKAREANAEWVREDFKATETQFIGIQRAFNGSALFQKLRKDSPEIAREWAERIERARFSLSENEGAFARFSSADGPLIGEEKDLLGSPIRKIKDAEGRLTDVPTVLWRGGANTPDTKSGKLFQLLHESTHLMNWAPPTVQKCLADPKAAGARRGVSARDLARPDSTVLTDTERAFAMLAWGQDVKGAATSPAVQKDAARAKALIASCSSPRASLYRGDLFLPERQGLDPSSMSPELRKALDEILREPLKSPPLLPKKGPGGVDTRSGWGTAPFVEFESCLKKDAASALELFALVKQYRLPGLSAEDLFADQKVETVADFYATELAVEELEALPAKDRKAAVQDILRSFPPTLYPDDARAALDWMGSKKTNEGRVFGILLANPKFRQMLGCRFVKTTPLYCGE